jgi:hypothetical protein
LFGIPLFSRKFLKRGGEVNEVWTQYRQYDVKVYLCAT